MRPNDPAPRVAPGTEITHHGGAVRLEARPCLYCNSPKTLDRRPSGQVPRMPCIRTGDGGSQRGGAGLELRLHGGRRVSPITGDFAGARRGRPLNRSI